MKKMMAIYRKEMMQFFVSPVAYIVTCVFLVIAGYLFSIILFYTQEANLRGFFANMRVTMLLITPILTMRLLAEEKKLGTEELLLTSPLTNYDIILGKYLATLSLFIIMLFLTLEFPVILKIYGEPDMGQIYSGYAGILLFGSAFLSVGLFSSSLTSNQIIAAIISFGILLLLWLISWAGTFLPEGLKGFLEVLSVMDHYANFEKGLIDLADVFYYISFCFIFIFLSNQVSEAKRWR